MLHDFLIFNGGDAETEIVNLDRFLTYGRLFGGAAWQNLSPRNEYFYPAMTVDGTNVGGPYTTPVADAAPWILAGIPESEGFGGVMIEAVEGGGGLPLTRQTYLGSSGGGSFGAARIGPRVQNYRARMVGAGELQLDYGFEWFTQILAGKCADPMARPSLTWFAGRPNTRGVACAGITDLATRLPADWLRTGFDVALTGAPEVISRWATQGCFSMYEVHFQLTFGNPRVFGAQANLVNALSLETNAVDVTLPCCDETPSFVPPCYAEPFNPNELGGQNCWCQPDRVYRNAATIQPVNTRPFAPEVEIVGGAGDSEHLRLVFYERRPNDPSWDPFTQTTVDFFECERKLSVIEIPFLPDGATFRADGRTGEISITTSAGETVFRQVAQGENGAPMYVPSSDGCANMLIVIETNADPNNVGPAFTAPGTIANMVRHDIFTTTGGA